MDRVMDMTWKAMSTERFFEVMEFWIRAPWPMDRPEAQALAAGLGWVVREDGILSNPVDGLSHPGVRAVATDGELGSVNFWVTDVVPSGEPEAEAFLNDQFAVLVREAKVRWGRPSLSRTATNQFAQWELQGGGRVNITRQKRSVTAWFTTPQYAQVLRASGE